jgi:hypothetical protein
MIGNKGFAEKNIVMLRFRSIFFVWNCLLLFAAHPATALSDAVAPEYAVKAAILYKITKFVSWPAAAFEESEDYLSICVFDGSPFDEAIAALDGRSVRNRTIRIVTLDDSGEPPPRCQVLFVSRTDEKRAGKFLNSTSGQPILTVGEGETFVRRGGIVSLQVEQSRVSFSINVEESQRAGLDISAQLLQLAKIIEKDGT